MILVDVYVPAVDQTYDFDLDEEAYVSELVDEMTEMVIQSSQSENVKNQENVMLCSYGTRQVLMPDKRLCDYGIKNGSRLILV